MVLIELPYLKFVNTNSMYFIKYQLYRILFSFVILVLRVIWQLNEYSDYFTWMYLACFIVFLLHFGSFYYFAINFCWLGTNVFVS